MTAGAHSHDHDPLPHSRLTSAFERRVGRTLAAHVAPDAPLVIATSGGPDSTALLVAAARSRGGRGATVAAYFDHGMRPAVETEGDRALVRTLARALDVAVRTGLVTGAAPLRGEAAARVARYRWLAAVCEDAGATAAATGHTLDDQAETVLLRLTRGTGLAGAAGMSAVASWPVLAASGSRPPLQVVRPLLDVTRDDVLDYLDALELEAREDATNELLTFDRNRVRLRVLSELRRVNPRVAAQLARFATLARHDDAALNAWAMRELAAHGESGGGVARVRRAALLDLPIAVSTRMLRLSAERLGMRLDHAQVEQLLTLARRRRLGVALPGGAAVADGAWLELRASGAACAGPDREVGGN